MCCRRPPGLRELQRWAALAASLASRGWSFPAALRTSWHQLFVRAEAAAAGAEEIAAVAEAAFEAHLLPVLGSGGSGGELCLHRPAAWPQPLGVDSLCGDSAWACTRRDAAVLLHYLARLAAAELLQARAGSGSGIPAPSREALVADLGLATAAAMPPPAAALRQESEAATTLESAAPHDIFDWWLLCAPAAARVFAERSGAGHHAGRAAYIAALAGQLQRLLMAAFGETSSSVSSRALQAVQLAQQLVSDVLGHPLAQAVAALQHRLAAAVQMPAASATFLHLDAATSQQLQPYLLAAGLLGWPDCSSGSSGGSSSTLQELQETSSKLDALWPAVQAAGVLRCAAGTADDTLALGSATLLQLSCWRHQRPKVR